MIEDRLTKPGPFDDAWVLLWSESQRVFHIERLARCTNRNRIAFYRAQAQDFVLLSVDSSANCCSLMRRMLEENRKIFDEDQALRERLPQEDLND